MLVGSGACNKQELLKISSAKTIPSTESPAYQTAENIGIWHNACLDYLYDAFMPLKAENWTATEEEFEAELKSKILDYFTLTGYAAPNTNITYGSDFDPSLFSNEGEIVMSKIQESILNYEADLLSLNDFQSAMNEIQLEATGLEIEKEQYIIAITASVAKYSAFYWESEGMKYNDFYIGENHEKASPNQIAALKADANGAFWGTVGGLAGTGNVAIGAIGGMFGAAYKSSVEGFKQKGYDCWFCP